MTLSDLASLGSFVSGVAVVVTLVFLLLQMRQANRYQRAAMQLGRAARTENAFLRNTNPEVSRVASKALRCKEPLTEVETQLWMNNIVADFRGWEDTFLQHRAGLLEKASMATDEAAMRLFLSSPAYRSGWQLVSMVFNQDFRAYIDGLMRLVEPSPPGDTAPIYWMFVQEQLAQVKASPPDTLDHHAALAALQDRIRTKPANRGY